MPKNYYLLYTILILFPNYYINTDSPSKMDEDLFISVFNLGMNIIQNRIDNSNLITSISENCYLLLNNTFLNKSSTNFNETSKYYFKKFFLYSSKDENDLTTYKHCLNIENNSYIHPLFIIGILDYRDILFEHIKADNENKALYVYGTCFIEGCNENDQKVLTTFMLMQMRYITYLYNESNNTFFDFISFNNTEAKYQKINKNNYIYFIPAYIIGIHLIMIILNLLLFSWCKNFFSCCSKKKRINPKLLILSKRLESNTKSSLITNKTDNPQNSTYKFKNFYKSLFNVENNFNYLIGNDNSNENNKNKYSGLDYIYGIKGITMIFYIFGCVFIVFINSYIANYGGKKFYDTISNIFFCFFYYGIKFAPKILLVSSGFSLVYKFLNFLDENVKTKRESIKKEKFTEIEYDEEIDNSIEDNDLKKKINKDKNKNIKIKVPLKYYFIFLGYQLHKYLIYLLIVFFVLYSLFDLVCSLLNYGPMWKIFKKKLINPSIDSFSSLLSIFGFQSYFFGEISEQRQSILYYLYLLRQEIIYFLISSIIIFIGYRYNLRFDRFFTLSILFLWFFRITYCFWKNKEKDLNVREYFTFRNFGAFYTSLIYNYLYYLIGIYFGSLNYVIQKGLSYSDCKKMKKSYLYSYTRFVSFIKKQNKKCLYICALIFLILSIIPMFSQHIILKIFKSKLKGKTEKGNNEKKDKYERDILSEYNNSTVSSILMVFDADFEVLFINLTGLFMYLQGENVIIKILTFKFWNIFNKCYFSFILIINFFIIYVFYINETKFNFDLQNCYLLSFSCGIILILVMALFYIIFELPYKKAIKFLLKLPQKNFDINRLDSIEDYLLQENLSEKKNSIIEDDEGIEFENK